MLNKITTNLLAISIGISINYLLKNPRGLTLFILDTISWMF